VVLDAPFPVDVAMTLAPFRSGPSDPTMHIDDAGVWRAVHTVDGPATIRFTALGPTSVEVVAWGRGRTAALGAAPAMLGFHDDHDDFVAHHEVVRRAHRRHVGVRIGVGGSLMATLVATILEQKVTSGEAHRSWARLVHRYGEPAPGPARLRSAPPADRLAALHYPAWHPLGVERRRADTVRSVCARAGRLTPLTDGPPAELRRVLEHFPGVGPWTSSKVALLSLGARDEVVVGDYNLPHLVAHSLTGARRGTDEQMLELLEPYRPHRARAMRLIGLGGTHPPRRAPRARPRDLAAI
jgi:3-methyladenine DNA glycosylase/8-oxoguanine DNA glycosylase